MRGRLVRHEEAGEGRAMINDTEGGRDAVVGAPRQPGQLRSAMSDYARARMARGGGLLLEGAASPLAVTADADYFGRLRDRVREAGQR